MSPRIQLLLAFALGVAATVGAYETARLVRTTRQVLALAEPSPKAPSARAARVTRFAPAPEPAAGAGAAPEPDGAATAKPAAPVDPRAARRARMERMAERRVAAGLPKDPREARQLKRLRMKAAMMGLSEDDQAFGRRPDEGTSPGARQVDTGR